MEATSVGITYCSCSWSPLYVLALHSLGSKTGFNDTPTVTDQIKSALLFTNTANTITVKHGNTSNNMTNHDERAVLWEAINANEFQKNKA